MSGIFRWRIGVLVLVLLVACRPAASSELVASLTPAPPTRTPSPSPTFPPTPTSTPEPLAALVNGEPILLVEWEAETQRLLDAAQALNRPLPVDEAQRWALQSLIVETLLAQAAREQGYQPTPEELEERLQALEVDLGADELQRRLQALGYADPEMLRRSLTRAVAAAWMRDQILREVPTQAEQVEVRQILLLTLEQAQAVYLRLQQGTPFLDLARAFDPQTWGYLGWMPRKVWPTQEMEEVVFSLSPGSYSPVLSSPLGYHILYIHRREVRPLPAWARRLWAQDTLRQWVQKRWGQADLQFFVLQEQPLGPPGELP